MQRTGHECPVCARPCQPPVLVGHGEDRIKYLHTDLVGLKEYCLIYADGETESLQESVSESEARQ